MKKVYQTKNKCFEACLAFILQTDIKNIPSYKGKNWYFKYKKWLSKYNLDLLIIRGWKENEEKFIPKVFAIGSGISHRGKKHAVVYFGCQMAYDPYPDNNGLVSLTEMIYIIPQKIKIKYKEVN
jgi:hypothetical protein